MNTIKTTRIGSRLQNGEWGDVFTASYQSENDSFHYKFVAEAPSVPKLFDTREAARAAARSAYKHARSHITEAYGVIKPDRGESK